MLGPSNDHLGRNESRHVTLFFSGQEMPRSSSYRFIIHLSVSIIEPSGSADSTGSIPALITRILSKRPINRIRVQSIVYSGLYSGITEGKAVKEGSALNLDV
jgi:hypothetical protein